MDEVVVRFGLTRAEVYRRVKDGVLNADKIDRRLSFPEAEVARYAEVLDQERDLLSRLLDRWLPWFGERLAGYDGAVVRDVDGEPVEARIDELGARIVQDALLSGASDLHLDPVHAGARLIQGSASRTELARFDTVLSVRLVQWATALTELLPVGDGGVREGLAKHEWGALACQIRVREIPTVLGPHYHLHLFAGVAETSLEDVGYTREQIGALRQLLAAGRGLFLIADAGEPRDDLHRLLLARETARRGRLVVAIERRVQFQEESLIQLELKLGAAESREEEFRAVWRAALDMSPDVVVVDEVASAEQMAALCAGAASGTTVILRMAGDRLAAAGARVIEFGARPRALRGALLGGVERVVARRVCPDCGTRRPIAADAAAALGVAMDLAAARTVGCSRCRDGYAGRRAIFGLWRDGVELARHIADTDGAQASVLHSGERDFAAALRIALLEGDITAEDALRLLPTPERGH